MTEVSKINSNNYKQPLFNTQNTGYATLCGIGLTTASAIIKPVRKCHKPLGFFTLIVSLMHLDAILSSHKENKEKKEFVA